MSSNISIQNRHYFTKREKKKELNDHYEFKDTGFDYTPEDQELTGKICMYMWVYSPGSG